MRLSRNSRHSWSLGIRVDATPILGAGHWTRCLSLAQAARDRGVRVYFAYADAPAAFVERLKSEKIHCCRVRAVMGTRGDAQRLIQLAQQKKWDWMVVDGYQFPAEFHRVLSAESPVPIMSIDDYGHLAHYAADVLLNPNPGVRPRFYDKVALGADVLAGPDYALLRREFRHPPSRRVRPGPPYRVLVSLGAGDPHNLTAKILSALGDVDLAPLRVVALLGRLNPHAEAVGRVARRHGWRIEVDTPNMKSWMRWSDVAVVAGGSTNWELAFMGVPALIYAFADNQRNVVRWLGRRGLAIAMGWYRPFRPRALQTALTHLLRDRSQRQRMAEEAQRLIDGKGAARVVDFLSRRVLRLRRARPSDALIFWRWANDAVVRSAAFSTEKIPWSSHLRWFRKKLADPGAFVWLASDLDGRPLGQVRFDNTDTGVACVDVHLAPRFRGRHLGAVLIRRAVGEMRRSLPRLAFRAQIKRENTSSKRAFSRAGFVVEGGVRLNGQPVDVLSNHPRPS